MNLGQLEKWGINLTQVTTIYGFEHEKWSRFIVSIDSPETYQDYLTWFKRGVLSPLPR